MARAKPPHAHQIGTRVITPAPTPICALIVVEPATVRIFTLLDTRGVAYQETRKGEGDLSYKFMPVAIECHLFQLVMPTFPGKLPFGGPGVQNGMISNMRVTQVAKR